MRTNYIESNIEKDIDSNNQFRISYLPAPISIRELCSKNYVENKFNNVVHFNDKKLEIIKFDNVNYQPAVDSQLTPKTYVDSAIDKIGLVGTNQDNDFHNFNLTNIIVISVNTQAVNDNQVNTKAHADRFHNDNQRFRGDLGLQFHIESSDLVKTNQDSNSNDNKLTNLDSTTVNRYPILNYELASKKHIDDELDKNTVLKVDKSLQNHLKIPNGCDVYYLTKYD